MSLVHALRHEVKPASATVLPHSFITPNPTAPEQIPEVQNVADDNLTPREGQPVFEQTLPSRTTQSRRVAITGLLVLANLVQVCRGFAVPAGYTFDVY
jgi:hypothetical protein